MSNVVDFEAYRNHKLAKQEAAAFKSTVPCAGCGRPMLIVKESQFEFCDGEIIENGPDLLVGVCFPCNHTVPVGVTK